MSDKCVCGKDLPKPDTDGTTYEFCSSVCAEKAALAAREELIPDKPKRKYNMSGAPRRPRRLSNRAVVAWDGESTDMKILGFGGTDKSLLRGIGDNEGTYAFITILKRFAITKQLSFTKHYVK